MSSICKQASELDAAHDATHESMPMHIAKTLRHHKHTHMLNTCMAHICFDAGLRFPEFVNVVKSLSIFGHITDDHHLDKIKQDAENSTDAHGKSKLRQRNGHAFVHDDAAKEVKGH